MFVTSNGGGLKRKMRKKVGTHNGTFHCDEALGCFMNRLMDRFGDAEVVCTREQKWNRMKLEYDYVIAPSAYQILEPLAAVLDVGGVYNSETDHYDHHQRGFDQSFGNGFVTKLSSAGLVYKLQFMVWSLDFWFDWCSITDKR